jgi:hypothetical protein
MTDNEIVKALECCIKSSHFLECFENECPCISEQGCKVGKETLYPYALDLINRQKAEIERLKEQLNSKYKWENMLGKKIKEVKAEAIKEFAERLKEKKFELDDQNEDIFYAVEVSDIENLVKEMVGDTNA